MITKHIAIRIGITIFNVAALVFLTYNAIFSSDLLHRIANLILAFIELATLRYAIKWLIEEYREAKTFHLTQKKVDT